MRNQKLLLIFAITFVFCSANNEFLPSESPKSIQDLAGLVEDANHFATELMKFLVQTGYSHQNLTENELIESMLDYNRSALCDRCMNFVSHQQKIMDSKIVVHTIGKAAEKACSLFMNKSVCAGIMGNFISVIIHGLSMEIFKPQIKCAQMFMCPHNYHRDTLRQWTEKILANTSRVEPPKPTKRSTYKFLHITDLHVDFSYTIGNNAFCNEPLCCRAEDGPVSDPSKGAQYWGTTAACDIPMRTVEQFFQFINNTQDIDFILWTGDNIAHNIWEQNQATQAQNTLEITLALQKYLPEIPVYPIFGNHECYPADQCDFTDNATAWLTDQLADMWHGWLDEQAEQSLRTKTFYSIYNEELNLRVISLNTQVCDTMDFYLLANPTDPLGHLAWLREQLHIAEHNGEAVFIMGHIPPGDSTCDSAWAARYGVLVERYSHIIRGQFFGHTHNDQIEVVKSIKDGAAVGVVYIAPSLTTFSNLKPSFRVFEADTDTNTILNYYQYRLDLNKWNSNTSGPIEWDLAYDAISEYKLNDMSFASFQNFAQNLEKDKELIKTYISNFYTGIIPKKKVPAEKMFACMVKNGVFVDAVKCGLPGSYNKFMVLIQQYLPGPWYSFSNEELIQM